MKKYIKTITLSMLIAVILCLSVFAAGAKTITYICGDADRTGDVDVNDISAIQRYMAKYPTSSFLKKAADVNNDDDISVTDVTLLQRYLSGYNIFSNIGQTLSYDEYELPFIPIG